MTENRESVFDEPWMRPPPLNTAAQPPPDSHAVPDQYDTAPRSARETGPGDVETVLHSAHSEPERAGTARATQLNELMAEKRKSISPLAIVGVPLLTALLAGPVSIIGTLLSGNQGYGGMIYPVLVGPVVEEMMKLAAILYLVEKKPWFIYRGSHIVPLACISALLFGVIENLVYQYVYLGKMQAGHRADVMQFRWTVTVLLHTSTTLVGALGIRRAWMQTVARGKLFDSQIAEPAIAAAICIHSFYNIAAILVHRLRGVL